MVFTLLNPPASSFPRKFPQTFSNASQPFLSVAFKFILKSWSSNSCLWTNENSFFHLGLTILEKFASNRQTLRFLYPSPAEVLKHELQQILGAQTSS